MNPKLWRLSNKLSRPAILRRLGLIDHSPTAFSYASILSMYYRWEKGLTPCPLPLVVAIEKLSKRKVQAKDWLNVLVDRHGETRFCTSKLLKKCFPKPKVWLR